MEHSNQNSVNVESAVVNSESVRDAQTFDAKSEAATPNETIKNREVKASKADSFVNKLKRAVKFETSDKRKEDEKTRSSDIDYSENFTDESFFGYDMAEQMQFLESDFCVAEVIREVAGYENQTADTLIKSDFEKIKAAYPNIAQKSIGEFGDEFLRLVILGYDPLIAYEAVRAKQLREKKEPPPNIGAVNNVSGEEKDFYTPEEVDKLTREDFKKNPRLLEVVRKSMLKWNK